MASIGGVNPSNLGNIKIIANAAGPTSAGSGGGTASTGGFCGDEERISQDPCNSQYPAVAFDGVGNVGITWQDNKDGNFEIYLKLLQSRLDPSRLSLSSMLIDPATGKPMNLDCSGISGAAASGVSGVSGLANVLVTQGSGRLDVNSSSRTMVLTASSGTKDFQSIGATVGSAVGIINGPNAGKTFFIQSLASPSVAQLVFVDGASSDFGFVYTITRSDASLSTEEVRLTCNKGSSLFPDIVADTAGRFHIVFQDDSTGNFELYYIQVYPEAVGKAQCGVGGSSTATPPPINFTGFAPLPVPSSGSAPSSTPFSSVLILVPGPPPVLVSYPLTGTDGQLFTFGDPLLRDAVPITDGPVLQRTGIHKIFNDSFTGGHWAGVSLAADRATWNSQAAADSITVQPDFFGAVGNPIAAQGDFGTTFTFQNIAFIAQSPPDRSVRISKVELPLKPKCVPPAAQSAGTPDYEDLVSAPKDPLPPTFQDPVSLADIFQSPMVSIDESVPARFTVQGDASGTIFTNILMDNGLGQLSRFVFNCAGGGPDLRFILSQRMCGSELCAMPADSPGNGSSSSGQYEVTLQIWQGPDYRFVFNQNLSAQMNGAVKLIEKTFAFDPGEDINTFAFEDGEVTAMDGRYLFFVPIAGKGVEFFIQGVGGGHEIWSTSNDGSFEQYYVPFTIQPNAGLDAPVYYEGYLADPTSGVNFYPPGTQISSDCTGLSVDSTIDVAFTYNAIIFPSGPGNPNLFPSAVNFPHATQTELRPNTANPHVFTLAGQVGYFTDTPSDPTIYTTKTNLFTDTLIVIGSLGVNELTGAVQAGASAVQGFVVSQALTLTGITIGAINDLSTGATLTASLVAADANGNPVGPAIVSASIPAPAASTFAANSQQTGNFGVQVAFPLCAALQPGNYAVVISSDKDIHIIGRTVTSLIPGVLGGQPFTPAATVFFPVTGQTSPVTVDGVTYTAVISSNVMDGFYTLVSMQVNFHNGPPSSFTTTQSPINTTAGNQATTGTGGAPEPNVLPTTGPSGASGDITTMIATPPLQLTTSTGDSVHPRLAIDSNGNIFCVFHSNRTGSDEVYVIRYFGQCGQWISSDTGGTDFKLTSAGDDGGFVAQFPEVAVDSLGNSHIVYQSNDTEDSQYDIFYVRSTGSGSSYLSPKRISASPAQAQMPAIAISSPVAISIGTSCSGTSAAPASTSASGKVTVVWHDNRYGNYEIVAADKTNGKWNSSGQGGFDTRLTLAPGDSLFPRISSDHRGNLRVVYHDKRRGISNPWIFMSSFVASASAWDSSGQGGTDIPITPSGQFESLNPDIDIDALNGVFVVWHDSRFQVEGPDQHEEIMGSYCPRLDSPAGLCGPICTNVESFLSTQFNVIDCVSGLPIQVTNTPNVCLSITSPNATFYRVQNDGGDFSEWQPFKPGTTLDNTTVPWVLSPGSGNKTICVQAQDATTVGFPVCQKITLIAPLPTFRIEFFKDQSLTIPLPTFKSKPVAAEGDVFVRFTSSIPLVNNPTFDVASRGIRFIAGQETVSLTSGFSGASGSSGFSGTSGTSSGFSASVPAFLSQDFTTNLGVSQFSANAGTQFAGRFHVFHEDGLFYQDGMARVIPHGKDVRGQVF